MISWDQAQTSCQDLSSDSTAASLIFFKRMMNVGYKYILTELGRPVTERTYTAVTVASQQYYQMPPDYIFLKSVTITVGGKAYPMVEEESQEMWNYLNLNTQSSDIPAKYFLRPGFGINGAEIGFYPAPSSAGNTITTIYEASDKDLDTDVYATGTVSITTGTAALVGVGTTFTASMVGKYIKITNGDGFFYKLSGFTDVTHMTLENVYEGNTIAGQAFQISELFALPEEMQMLPVYYALWFYWMGKKDKTQSSIYKGLFDTELALGKNRHATKSRSNIIRGRGYASRWAAAVPGYFPSTVT